jgi:hypothetical protein
MKETIGVVILAALAPSLTLPRGATKIGRRREETE